MFFYISVEIFISLHEGVGAFWNVLIRFVHSPQQDYILNEPLFCYIYRMSVLGVCLYVKIFLLREYLLTVGVDRLIDFQKFICGDFLTALKKDVTLRSRPLQDFTDKLVNMYF